MKILVLGACGLVAAKVASSLRQLGYAVATGSPGEGRHADAGQGLAAALHGVEVLIDVREPPPLDAPGALEAFEAAGHQLNAAMAAAGVEHHIALSALGLLRMGGSGHHRAKAVQERMVQAGANPYTIVRAAPLYECLARMAHCSPPGAALHVPLAQVQAIAAEDLAMALADAALARPQDGSMDVAGPQRMAMADWMQQYLCLRGDPRTVVPDADARYLGQRLDDSCLLPAGPARLGSTTLAAWVSKSGLLNGHNEV